MKLGSVGNFLSRRLCLGLNTQSPNRSAANPPDHGASGQLTRNAYPSASARQLSTASDDESGRLTLICDSPDTHTSPGSSQMRNNPYSDTPAPQSTLLFTSIQPLPPLPSVGSTKSGAASIPIDASSSPGSQVEIYAGRYQAVKEQFPELTTGHQRQRTMVLTRRGTGAPPGNGEKHYQAYLRKATLSHRENLRTSGSAVPADQAPGSQPKTQHGGSEISPPYVIPESKSGTTDPGSRGTSVPSTESQVVMNTAGLSSDMLAELHSSPGSSIASGSPESQEEPDLPTPSLQSGNFWNEPSQESTASVQEGTPDSSNEIVPGAKPSDAFPTTVLQADSLPPIPEGSESINTRAGHLPNEVTALMSRS